MAQTIRVSLPGYNALTEANIYNYSLYSDSDNILIKELSRGIGTVNYLATATIAHNLEYVPMFFVYCETADDVYVVANNFDIVGSGWRAYADSTNLYIRNYYSSTYKDYRYYIFYDLVV